MKAPQELIWLPTGGHVGDAVMILSLFAEILRQKPELRIQYLVRRNAPLITELAHAYPQVTVLLVPYAPWAALKAVLPIFAKRAAVIAAPAWGNRPFVLKVLAFLCKLRGDRVVAFEDGSAWQPYSARVTHHKEKRYIDNLRAAAHLVPFPTEPFGSPPRLEFVTTLPKEFPFKDKSYIVIHPFPHMSKAKTIPLRRWKQLVQTLQSTYPQYGLVITGAEVDRREAEKIGAREDRVYLAINLPILEVAGLIQYAKLYIGVDTGPTHIAGVLGAPSVILAQQKEPMWLPTYNPNALLVWEKKNCVCGIPGKSCEAYEDGELYRRCVYDISDEALLAAIKSKLPVAGSTML